MQSSGRIRPMATRAGMALATSGVVSMPRPVARPAFDNPTRNAPRYGKSEGPMPSLLDLSGDGSGLLPAADVHLAIDLHGVAVELQGEVENERRLVEHHLGNEGVDRRPGAARCGRLLGDVAPRHAARLPFALL